MFDFHIGPWIKGTLEIISTASVAGAIMSIVPPATAIVGLIYWSVMLYRLFKKKDK